MVSWGFSRHMAALGSGVSPMTYPLQQFPWRDSLLLALFYLLTYGWFLGHTAFLPYVFDNNESFSALVHGSNLYHFGVGTSFGLTDEAYGPDPAAHPYVYTHQGNFPRLFAFLLYAAGIRTVEAQIAVSTFTVGLATIVLIHLFFSRLAGRACGAIVALLFMTDYVLSAQWQVNTFKVWHGFLLFAMLASIQQYDRDRHARWLLALGTAALCVGYFDLLMAVFTFVFCTVFAVFTFTRRNKTALALTISSMFAGGFVSVVVFLAQLVGYYGWDGLKQDFYLTFVGRNFSANDPEAIRQWQQFFIQKNIVFWEALVDSRPFASFGAALGATFQYGFSVLTPYLTFFVLALASAPLVHFLICATWRDIDVRFRLALTATLIIMVPAACVGPWGAAVALPYAGLTVWASLLAGRSPAMHLAFVRSCLLAACFGFNLLLSVILLTDAIEGRPDHIHMLHLSKPRVGTELLVVFAAVVSLLYYALARRHIAHDQCSARTSAVRGLRMLAAGTYGMLLSIYALGQVDLFGGDSMAPIWSHVLAPWTQSEATRVFAIIVAGMCFASLFAGSRAIDLRGRAAGRGAAAYLTAALAGYLAAYFFSPGYMVLINLKRYVPVLVFLLLPLVAIAAYVFLRMTTRARASTATVMLAAFAGLHLVVFWFGLQAAYFALLPPDAGAVFAKLGKPPFVHKTFVVNSYGAPVAVKTGNWAYIDQRIIASGEYALEADGYRLASRDIYKWFADRNNPKYRYPEFALCFDMPGFHHALHLLEILRRNKVLDLSPAEIYRLDDHEMFAKLSASSAPVACDGAFLAQRAEDNATEGPALTLMERDPSLLHRWSIQRLENEFPPFLEVLDEQANERIRVRISRYRGQCSADVEYRYRQQQGTPESGTLMHAWVDEKSLAGESIATTIYAGAPKRSLRVRSVASGTLYVSITPASTARRGSTFVSAPLELDNCRM